MSPPQLIAIKSTHQDATDGTIPVRAGFSRFWNGLVFLSDPQLAALMHEDPEYWAALIFCERRR
jgi:hypothetical protein